MLSAANLGPKPGIQMMIDFAPKSQALGCRGRTRRRQGNFIPILARVTGAGNQAWAAVERRLRRSHETERGDAIGCDVSQRGASAALVASTVQRCRTDREGQSGVG